MRKAAHAKRWAFTAVLSVLMAASMAISVFVPAFRTNPRLAEAEESAVQTDTSGGAKAYIVNEHVRVTPISETIVRLEEKGTNGFENRDTFYVLGRDEFTAPESDAQTVGEEVVITTEKYIVHIPKDAADLTGARVTDKNNITLYSYNGVTLANTYLPSPSEDPDGWYFCDYPRIIPGDHGYSLNKDGLELNGWDFSGRDVPDVYVFVPGDYTTFCEDFVTLTGKSNLVDLKTLGFWDSRWYIYDAESALQQVQDYLDRGYSIDVLVIDTNWRAGTVNEPGSTAEPSTGGMGYEIDTRLFPDMADTLQKLHDMGVNVIFNDHPTPTENNTNGLEEDEIDYRSKNLKAILSLGLDMWWYDRNWHTALKSADSDLSVFAWGMYAFQFIENEYYEEMVRPGSEDVLKQFARRAIIMGNVDGCENGYWRYGSDISAHRNTIQWTGDIGVDDHSLSREIHNAIFGSAENGIPYVSADLGGHTGAVTDDMYARWLQFGALSTITRVHCTHVYYCHQEGRMPWLFGETAENVVKEYVGMKYNLMPTYYSLAAENAQTGLPILRRLDVKYPQYAEASRNDEYLLGDGVIIAPINEGYSGISFGDGFFTSTDENGNTHEGLLGKYCANTNYSNPAYTQYDKNMVFDWAQGSPTGLPSDNFSIEWKGQFHVGRNDIRFSFFADDRVQVLIDDKLVVNSASGETNQYDVTFYTDYYAAGTTHDIEIRYVEEGNYAHFYMYGLERPTGVGSSYCYDSREVFLPDGIWVDVWSGKEYEGPFTYTVTHPLETSPIFVRKGTLNVLAPDMKNLNEKDWSELTLDAYPSASKAETSLYEDDTLTQAYREGHFRTTKISAEAKDGKYTVTIGAAQGSFEGPKAFTERTWNVRLHVFEELGGVKSVTVNGKRVSGMRYYSQQSSASPFAFSGASSDTAVCEFTFHGNIGEVTEIVVEFGDNSRLATFAKNSAYNATSATFTVESKGSVNGLLDLDNEAYDDWAFFGSDTSRKQLSSGEHLIGDVWSDFELYNNAHSAVNASWENAEDGSASNGTATALAGQVDANVVLKVPAGQKKIFTLFLSTELCIGKLTVRDRAGNVRTIILDDAVDGLPNLGDSRKNAALYGNTSRIVTIEVEAEEDTELYVRYSMHSSAKHDGAGTGSDARVGISAVVCSESKAELESKPALENTTITGGTAPDSASLSEVPEGIGADENLEVLDWLKTNEGEDFVTKAGGAIIDTPVATKFNPFGDYTTGLSWTDGEEVASNAGSRNGYHTDSNQTMTITFHVDENTKYIVLYVGAWNGTNTVTVSDYLGIERGRFSFTGGQSSNCQRLVIPIEVEGETLITVQLKSTTSGNGNASLAGVQVLGLPAGKE